MSVQFSTNIKRGTTEWSALPEELTVRPELNGRHDAPPIDDLVASILEHGQLQPVLIRREAGKPTLVAGFSRWRAVARINKDCLTGRMKPTADPMRLRCSYTDMSEEEGFLANIEENRVRNRTTEIDDAANLRRLVAVYGLSHEECAQRYSESVKWVKARLELVSLSRQAVKAVREGRVIGPVARKLARMTAEQQKEVIEAHPEGRITAAALAAGNGTSGKAKPNLKTLAAALFKGVDEETLRNEDDEYVSVERKRLLKLWEAVS